MAREAYTTALESLKQEVGKDGQWLAQHNSIQDILAVATEAQTQHIKSASSSKTKAVSLWLEAISSRVVYYGSVVDTLVQQHPEYLSLAWGAIKFVMTVRNDQIFSS